MQIINSKTVLVGSIAIVNRRKVVRERTTNNTHKGIWNIINKNINALLNLLKWYVVHVEGFPLKIDKTNEI